MNRRREVDIARSDPPIRRFVCWGWSERSDMMDVMQASQ